MLLVTVTVDSTTRRRIAVYDGRIIRDDFNEADHPRASNGQFGSGTTVSIVTTHDPDSGETEFHHVGTDSDAAAEAFEAVDGDEDSEYEPELHAPKTKGKRGQRSDTVHIVHSGDGAAGVDIHGVHIDAAGAQQQAADSSEADWDEHGPDRADRDRDPIEEDDAAQGWNAERADDDGALLVKVNADGTVDRDTNGALQWVQDGVDVEPDEDDVAAFDEHFDAEYPADERPRFPGLDAANEHFEAEGRHESVFRIHTHKAE